MGKLDYFKLLSKACLGKLDDTEIDDLCQKYCRENIDKAGYLLSQQFKKMSNDEIAEFLKVYGLKLWKLYSFAPTYLQILLSLYQISYLVLQLRVHRVITTQVILKAISIAILEKTVYKMLL